MRILLIILLLPLSVLGQQDLGAWTGVKVHVPVNKRWNAGLEMQSRFESNISVANELFLSPYVEYDLKKWIRVDLAYRLTNYPADGYGHRESIDLVLQDLQKFIFSKKNRLSLDFRLRGTYEYRTKDENDTYLRFRFGGSYNLPKTKLKPSIDLEWFYHFNDQITYTFSSVDVNHRMNKYRIRFDLSYPITKVHSIKGFYIYQRSLFSDKLDHILGLKYSYEIKGIKK